MRPADFEIYVQQFPNAQGKWQISTNGGTLPRWHRNGREIVYLGLDGRLMSVPLSFKDNGTAVEAGTSVVLFRTASATEYDASPDLQRFLINAAIEEVNTAPITVILNWAGRRP